MGGDSTAALPLGPDPTSSAGTPASTLTSFGECSFLAADIISPWTSFIWDPRPEALISDFDLRCLVTSIHHVPGEARVAGQWHFDLAAKVTNPRVDVDDWLSIGTGRNASVVTVLWPEPLRPNDTDSLRQRIDELMRSLGRFPTSYNQSLLLGSLAYSGRALRRNVSQRTEAFEAIRRYVDYVEPLIGPFRSEVPSGWTKLDLGLCSDRFENLQDSLSELGIVPRLADMTIEDMLED